MIFRIFKFVLAIIFFAPFYVFGIILINLGLNEIQLGLDVRTWPIVDAHVEQCTIERWSARKGPVFRAAPTYTYSVAGVPYTGHRLTVDRSSTSNLEKQQVLCRQVTTMKPFVIRYDAAQPENALILVPDYPWISLDFIAGVILLTVITCFVAALLSVTDIGRKVITRFRAAR